MSTDLEYRPFPDERDDEFRAFMRYAFSPEQGPWTPDERDDDREFLADYRGLFDGDDPVAVCGHHEFTLRIRGDDRTAAGLSAVASPPEHRRQGHVKRLLAESLREYREDGVDYSVLWPFEYGFYANYGWATVSRYRLVTAPVDQLTFVDDAVATEGAGAGTFRRLDADDFPAVESVLAAMADRYDFTMARTEPWWRHRSLRGWDNDPFIYGWERDGELRGLLSYSFEEGADDDGGTMNVSDLAFADETAWLQLLRFCRNHDSQVERVRLHAPPDADLLDRVTDPRAVTQKVRTGPMFRLVDVASALERLAPSTVAANADDGHDDRRGDDAETDEFELVVTDPLADWNDGRFRIDLGGDAVTVGRVEPDGTSNASDGPENADVPDGTSSRATATADIGALSQLYAGYHSVDEAIRLGILDADGAAPALRALFPPRKTFLREGF